MEKDNVVTHMAAYDFKSSINVTVIFDESDEDEFNSDIKKKSMELLKDIETENEATLISKDTVRVSTEKENETDTIQKNECTKKTKKRKINESTNNCKKRKSNQLNAISVVAKDNDENVDSDPKNNYSDTSNATSIQYKKLIECNPFVGNLLKTVSNHLILIIEAYCNYVKSLQNASQDLIYKAKKDFLNLKHNIFGFSYSTVADILLPQKNNAMFIKDFLNDTLKLAEEKKKLYCSYEQLEILYFQMTEWTNKKRNYLNYMTTHNMSTKMPQHGNTTLTQILNKPTKPNNVETRTFCGQNNVHQKISTAASSETKKYLTQSSENRNSATCNNYSNTLANQRHVTLPSYNYCLFTLRPPENMSVAPATYNYPLVSPETLVHCSDYNSASRPPDCSTSSSQRTYNDTPRHNSKRITSNCTVRPSENNNSLSQGSCIFMAGPAGKEVTIHWNPSLLDNQNKQLPHRTITNNFNQQIQHSDQNRSIFPQHFLKQNTQQQPYIPHPTPYLSHPPPYYTQNQRSLVASQDKSDSHQDCQGQWTMEQMDLSTEATRSMSTDSGFMSPLSFNNSDHMYATSCVQENEIENGTTPLITHVTSLNPNVMYISDGQCSVCGKTTKKKCLGCLKRYYCSYECQRSDWDFHKHLCKKDENS